MSLYLIRHGQSEFNAAPQHDPDPMIIDARLTKLGEAQAQAAREQVKEMGIKHVICSPLTRAIQTALLIFDENASITVDATHRELLSHSCDVGRPPADLDRDFPMLNFTHLEDHWWHKGPGNKDKVPVEPEDVFLERVEKFKSMLQLNNDRPLAIVGHGNFFQEMIGRMLNNCEIESY